MNFAERCVLIQSRELSTLCTHMFSSPSKTADGSGKLSAELAPIKPYTPRILYDFELDRGHTVVVNGLRLCTFGHDFTINDDDKHMGWGWKDNPQREKFYAAQRARLAAGASTTDERFALEGSGAGCFAGDGLVTMADGTHRRVDAVEVGDKVMTRDGAAEVKWAV